MTRGPLRTSLAFLIHDIHALHCQCHFSHLGLPHIVCVFAGRLAALCLIESWIEEGHLPIPSQC